MLGHVLVGVLGIVRGPRARHQGSGGEARHVRGERVSGVGRQVGRGGHRVLGRGARGAAGAIVTAGDAVVDKCRGADRLGPAEVLGVALPADTGQVELVEQGGDLARVRAAIGSGRAGGTQRRVRPQQRVDLAEVPVGGGTPDRPRAPGGYVGGGGDDGRVRAERHVGRAAVLLGVLLRRLPGDQRDVVVHARVPGAVVVLEQDALGGEGLPQIGVVVEAGKGLVVGLVLQDDEPYVLYGPSGEAGNGAYSGGGGRSGGDHRGRDKGGCGEQARRQRPHGRPKTALGSAGIGHARDAKRATRHLRGGQASWW